MEPLTVKFVYDGIVRHVDNITLEDNGLIGFEVRKGGKFSYRIKRYSQEKITLMERIPPIKREGPKIGRIKPRNRTPIGKRKR